MAWHAPARPSRDMYHYSARVFYHMTHAHAHAISKSLRANHSSRVQPNDGGGKKSRQAAHDDGQRVVAH